jgi:hypothetical protein
MNQYQSSEQLIDCANFKFCKNSETKWVYDTNVCNEICVECDISFGKTLELTEKESECPIVWKKK